MCLLYLIFVHTRQGPYSPEVERLVPQPFIAQSLRIQIRKKEFTPICLRAEVYGCEIPRGKISSFSDAFTNSYGILL